MVAGKQKKGGGGRKGREGLTVRVKSARGRKNSSTKWLKRQLNDPYVEKAHKEGYRSRAAYKLQEMQERFGIIQKSDLVVDLGCAPGSWVQIALEHTGRDGHVIGMDLLPVDPMTQLTFIEGDFTEDEVLQELEETIAALLPDQTSPKVNVVLSDMAANSTGHSATDHLRIMLLLEMAMEFAVQYLAPGGHFCGKVLQGGTEKTLLENLRKHFTTVKHIKPKASRKESAENYVLAMGFKGESA